MRNFALQLKDRLLKTYEEQKKQATDNITLYKNMVEVSNVTVQELEIYVKKYKLIKNTNDELLYYKHVQPHILQYQITFEYLLNINKYVPFGTPKMKAKYLKTCFVKLNTQFKKKSHYFYN